MSKKHWNSSLSIEDIYILKRIKAGQEVKRKHGHVGTLLENGYCFKNDTDEFRLTKKGYEATGIQSPQSLYIQGVIEKAIKDYNEEFNTPGSEKIEPQT